MWFHNKQLSLHWIASLKKIVNKNGKDTKRTRKIDRRIHFARNCEE